MYNLSDIKAELAEINLITGPTLRNCATTLVDNYHVRYESVCDTPEEVTGMVLDHFINLGNEVAKHAKAGNLVATEAHARAIDILRHGLFQLDELSRTEETIAKLVKLADAMYSWTSAMGRL